MASWAFRRWGRFRLSDEVSGAPAVGGRCSAHGVSTARRRGCGIAWEDGGGYPVIEYRARRLSRTSSRRPLDEGPVDAECPARRQPARPARPATARGRLPTAALTRPAAAGPPGATVAVRSLRGKHLVLRCAAAAYAAHRVTALTGRSQLHRWRPHRHRGHRRGPRTRRARQPLVRGEIAGASPVRRWARSCSGASPATVWFVPYLLCFCGLTRTHSRRRWTPLRRVSRRTPAPRSIGSPRRHLSRRRHDDRVSWTDGAEQHTPRLVRRPLTGRARPRSPPARGARDSRRSPTIRPAAPAAGLR